MLSYYNYMFHLAETSAPYPMIRQMSEELPIIYANNMKFWQPETSSLFDSVLPGMVISNRMAWKPQEKPAAILDDFYTKFYGAAAAPMRRYWQIFDDAWNKVPEHGGAGFGYMRRFTPEVLKAARAAMDEALLACQTQMERRRVEMHAESLQQFELYMKLRWELAGGKLEVQRSSTTMEREVTQWMGHQMALGDKYESAFAFGKVGWTPYTFSGEMFKDNFLPAYNDRVRIARNYKVISPALRHWRYQADKEKQGEAAGWQRPEFDDSGWKLTDPCIDTWYAMGLDAYYGPVWYRDTIKMPAVPAGKKIFLWVSSTDGTCKVFINGKHVLWVNDKGEARDEFSGWCNPASWDITAAIQPNADNHIAIIGTRLFANELGTGGLLGPVLLYTDK
jgi:hypothetical protein